VNTGLDHLLQYYCSGRASWGIDDNVTKTYCKDTSSTTCPTGKPSGVGRVSDYVHLWAAGELAIRKGALGARLPVFRERLKCAANDGDMGFAGYALFVLGYLGDDAGTKSFLQTKASAGGDLGTIAKAALYLTGDTAQKADVQAGMQASSVFVKVACAAALGIADKDDEPVTSALIPQVKWNNPAEASEDGKGMYAAHILEIAAFARRGWVPKGLGDGAVTFYGETSGATGGTPGSGGKTGAGGTVGTGGISGAGGNTGTRDPGTGAQSGTGGAADSGGRSGSGGGTGAGRSGGAPGLGGGVGNGGQGAGGTELPGSGGATVSGRGGAGGASGAPASGGSTTNPSGGTTGGDVNDQGSGCKCNLGRRSEVPAPWFLALAGLLLARRRRR
jgi:hypothetical protein